MANTEVPEEFKRKNRTISPDPVLWRRMEEEAAARGKRESRRVTVISLLDEAMRQYLDRLADQ